MSEERPARYFLKVDYAREWSEVTKQVWIRAERSAGFRPKMASSDPRYMEVCATGSFSGNGVSGTVQYDGTEPNY